MGKNDLKKLTPLIISFIEGDLSYSVKALKNIKGLNKKFKEAGIALKVTGVTLASEFVSESTEDKTRFREQIALLKFKATSGGLFVKLTFELASHHPYDGLVRWLDAEKFNSLQKKIQKQNKIIRALLK